MRRNIWKNPRPDDYAAVTCLISGIGLILSAIADSASGMFICGFFALAAFLLGMVLC